MKTDLEFQADCHGDSTTAHPRHSNQTQGSPPGLVDERDLQHTERPSVSASSQHPSTFTPHEATHGRHSEDRVDDADSNGGVDGLTDACPSKDGRGVIEDLGDDTNTKLNIHKQEPVQRFLLSCARGFPCARF